MAIDTAQKRRSAAGCGFSPLGPGVTPDAARPAAWRQQAGWGYSGIPAAAAGGEPGGASGGWAAVPGVNTWAAAAGPNTWGAAPGRRGWNAGAR
jgi:hypothetical protein